MIFISDLAGPGANRWVTKQMNRAVEVMTRSQSPGHTPQQLSRGQTARETGRENTELREAELEVRDKRLGHLPGK